MKKLQIIIAIISILISLPVMSQQNPAKKELHNNEKYDQGTQHRLLLCECGKLYYPWDARFIPCANRTEEHKKAAHGQSTSSSTTTAQAKEVPKQGQVQRKEVEKFNQPAKVSQDNKQKSSPSTTSVPKKNPVAPGTRYNRNGKPVNRNGYDYGRGDTVYYNGVLVAPVPEDPKSPAYLHYAEYEKRRAQNAEINRKEREKARERFAKQEEEKKKQAAQEQKKQQKDEKKSSSTDNKK